MSQSRKDELTVPVPVFKLKDLTRHFLLKHPELLTQEKKDKNRTLLEPMGITTAAIEKAQELKPARRKLKF